MKQEASLEKPVHLSSSSSMLEQSTVTVVDSIDGALRSASAIADLLLCLGNTPLNEGTLEEAGLLLTQFIRTAQESFSSVTPLILGKERSSDTGADSTRYEAENQ